MRVKFIVKNPGQHLAGRNSIDFKDAKRMRPFVQGLF